MKVTKDHNDLDKDEVNIISGVLEMHKKAVGEIMTPIEDAYMLPIDSILDFETMAKIMNSGKLSSFTLNLIVKFLLFNFRILSNTCL